MANVATWTPAVEEPSEAPPQESAEGENQPQKVKKQAEAKPLEFHVGDTVRVHYKLIEKEKIAGKTKREVKEETRERTQAFEGIVIGIKGGGENVMFTVRRIGAGNIGIERIFPLTSPWIKRMEVKKRGNVRRAKLYFLRGRTGRSATRINEAAPQTATA